MAEIYSDLILTNLEVSTTLQVSGENVLDELHRIGGIVNDMCGIEVGDLSQRIFDIETDLGSNNDNNIYIGSNTGNNNVGSRNIFIGNELGMNNTLSRTFLLGPSGTPLLYGDLSSNKLGINLTSTPTYELEVNGDISSLNLYTNSNVSIQGDLNICGETVAQNVTVSELNCLSDKTLKKNINSIENAIDIIQQLRPVSYNWKDPNIDDREQIGFIAQEVEKVIPSLVNNTNLGKKGIAYQKLIPLLTQGIQEQDNLTRCDIFVNENDNILIGNTLSIHSVKLNSYNLGKLTLKKCSIRDDFYAVYCGNKRYCTTGVCGILVSGIVKHGDLIYKDADGITSTINTNRPIGKALDNKISDDIGIVPVLLF